MNRVLWGALPLLCVSGCSNEDPESSEDPSGTQPSAEVTALSSEIEADFPDAGDRTGDEAEPVKLVLEFEGLGALHKSFFADDRVTSALQKRLQGHVSGAVGFVVSYDSRKGRGRIRIQAEAPQFVMPLGEAASLDLRAAVPLTQTVAFYRDWVASNFDFRVQNFDVSLEVTRGSAVCTFEPAGAPPPDGSEINPCFVASGEEVCGTLEDMVLSVPAAHHEAVGRCL